MNGLQEVVSLVPQSESLSNIAHIQVKEVSDTVVIYILILARCEILFGKVKCLF